jgi:hypothetical protein
MVITIVNRLLLLTLFSVICAGNLFAQTLPLPPRNPAAPSGQAFLQTIVDLTLAVRDAAIEKEFLAGNAPDFLKKFCAVNVTNVTDGVTNVGTFFVTPDYIAIGSDTDYFLAPISPGAAQHIADQLHCTLPTRKMVDAIYAAANVKLPPSPIPPSAAMTTVPVFAQHNTTVWAQRMTLTNSFPLGALTAGHKKDVVISARLAGAPGKLAIYGWHQTNGVPIQPLYLGHAWWWVDYSQSTRLVWRTMFVNGQKKSVAEVLADPKLCRLISDEGVITNARYPTNYIWPEKANLPWQVGFYGTANEWTRTIQLPDDVRILIDTPSPQSFAPDRPVELIFYALPNGNTIEETIGRKPQPGDGWHYDIQHIGAQTRWLRQVLTNETIVVAYLEAGTKSWPAWRKTNSDRHIAEILDGVRGIFSSNQTDVVLAGHSGGGSLIFGYLNAVDEIPAYVKRIAFLDSDYAYDSKLHAQKFADWLVASDENHLCVLAYQDYLGLLNDKPFVSETGGTWGRSRAMLNDLSSQFSFISTTNSGLETWSAGNGRIEFLLKENPDHKVLHTVQVELNGFIQSMLNGTPNEGRSYEYLGERAYTNFIQ